MIVYGYSMIRQRGVVLIMSLIFLLLLTILGFAAMQSSILQERMAGNASDYNAAFQAAEDGLKQAETYLSGTNALPTFSASTPGFILMLNNNTGSNAYWANTFPWPTLGIHLDSSNLGSGGTADYVIEQFPAEQLANSSGLFSHQKGAVQPAAGSTMYRITSRGYGPTGISNQSQATPVILQEIYGR